MGFKKLILLGLPPILLLSCGEPEKTPREELLEKIDCPEGQEAYVETPYFGCRPEAK